MANNASACVQFPACYLVNAQDSLHILHALLRLSQVCTGPNLLTKVSTLLAVASVFSCQQDKNKRILYILLGSLFKNSIKSHPFPNGNVLKELLTGCLMKAVAED